jgi:hypothetical protein
MKEEIILSEIILMFALKFQLNGRKTEEMDKSERFVSKKELLYN